MPLEVSTNKVDQTRPDQNELFFCIVNIYQIHRQKKIIYIKKIPKEIKKRKQ